MRPGTRPRRATDYFRILYIDTRPADIRRDASLPGYVQIIRDYTWEKSAHVRWDYAGGDRENPGNLAAMRRRIATANLVILDWSAANAEVPRGVYDAIRQLRPSLPILNVKIDSSPLPALQERLEGDPQYTRMLDLATQNLMEPGPFDDALTALGLLLPSYSFVVSHNLADPVVRELVERVGGQARLELSVQKFFPDAPTAQVEPVDGGWSDAPLCRIEVADDKNPYFIKFFDDHDRYVQELARHRLAKAWLGRATVKLRLIPRLDNDPQVQQQAFPATALRSYPVCYYSASTRDRVRRTLKDVYRTASDDFLAKAFGRLVKILSRNQPVPTDRRIEPPWSFSPERRFYLTREMTINLLAAVRDLDAYGPVTYRNTVGEWREYRRRLEEFTRGMIPTWFTEQCSVVYGNVHNDPNSRNCLVRTDGNCDLRLIDCGDYEERWRLVSDLAAVECDLKLVLLGTEEKPAKSNGQFCYDLDIRQVGDWCEAEREALAAGLGYSAAAVLARPQVASTSRAYKLIELVRKQAKVWSDDGDPLGRHYFAALLYWTLLALGEIHIRRTKKLFALCSAAEILQMP